MKALVSQKHVEGGPSHPTHTCSKQPSRQPQHRHHQRRIIANKCACPLTVSHVSRSCVPQTNRFVNGCLHQGFMIVVAGKRQANSDSAHGSRLKSLGTLSPLNLCLCTFRALHIDICGPIPGGRSGRADHSSGGTGGRPEGGEASGREGWQVDCWRLTFLLRNEQVVGIDKASRS